MQDKLVEQYRKVFYEDVFKEIEKSLQGQIEMMEDLKKSCHDDMTKEIEALNTTYDDRHNLLVHTLNKMNTYFKHVNDNIICL